MSAPKRYTGPELLQIAMPMGGIGAGCICLNGYGGLQDFSIQHKPDVTALPDSHAHGNPTAFALLHCKGGIGAEPETRLVEGPLPPEKLYDQALQAQGYRHGGFEGMPRFQDCAFEAEYPFGHVELSDPGVPLSVRVTGFSPFIPLDDKHSGMPAALLEYAFTNQAGEPVEMEFSYHLSHLAPGAKRGFADSRTQSVPGQGVQMWNTDADPLDTVGTACLLALEGEVAVKGMWFRGGWFDAVSALWREVSTGSFTENNGSNGIDTTGRNGGSILFRCTLAPGETRVFPLAVTWHFPNCNLTVGAPQKPAETTEDCCADSGCCGPAPAWRPYYAGVWENALDVAQYLREHYRPLRARTLAFKDALFSSTLPAEVLETVSTNLAIIKSPTVLRQENGNLWAWEGCFTQDGCCSGSCTHVWNYAQAFPHLFPALERTLRNQELLHSTDDRGHANFRSALPDGPTIHDHNAAADGQLGGILKLWRDWQISGDTRWLQGLYPHAKRSLEYCISSWDPERRGALFEPHHNTYDIEFWGPDGMCSSIYLGALTAMSELAEVCGDSAYAKECRALAKRGAAYVDSELFNGEYYQQNVMFRELRDQSHMERINSDAKSEVVELLRREGPKYQYGSGCLSDGIIGGWMAELYGVGTPLMRSHMRSTLEAIFRHNFKANLWDHVNLQRPGYALGHEAGLLLCTWPRGGKPTLPFVYSDEVWTGIEYQVASHLILHGLVEEGLTIVRGARSRFEGHVRNPFNEYECGSYYARALASYALLQSLSGFRYSAVTRVLEFGPRLAGRPFTCFFSTAGGFGTITLSESQLTVEVIEGELPISKLRLTLNGEVREIDAGDTVARAGQPLALECGSLLPP